jgi:hypothetical protein
MVQLQHGSHVDVELGLKRLVVGGPEFARSAESRIVDQDSDACGEPVGHLGAVGRDGQISRQYLDRCTGLVAELGGEAFEALDVAGDQDQVMTVDGVAAGESRAKTGCGSGDHCDGA